MLQFQDLLNEFGQKLVGKPELRPDAEGAVALDVDGMKLTILELPDVNQIALVSPIGEPPPADSLERLYRVLLEANHNFAGTAGATFSVDPASGVVSICRMLVQEMLDADSFYAEVERFVNTHSLWRQIIEDYRGSVLSASAETAAAEPAPLQDDRLAVGLLQV